MGCVNEDFERCYGALQSRDRRFDGWFFTAVTSTKIYCRPSCPARTPKPENVRFYATAAAAQQAGFRACLRCRPDAAPGSPEWLGRADVAARAVKLILQGTVDTEGVSGLARRLGYGERQLHRVLLAEVGTGALALARAQRAQTARLLLETTALPTAQVAFAAGFASVRQFNDTVRTIFAKTPTELRLAAKNKESQGRATSPSGGRSQSICLRLAYREPFSAEPLFGFLEARAVPGIEVATESSYGRSLRLPHGLATVLLCPEDGYVRAEFTLEDLRDLTAAVARCRHLLNLDADPVAIDEALSGDRLLGPLVEESPGLRVPGATDGFELAVRAVIGQQISVQGARTIAGRLAEAAGHGLGEIGTGISLVFPSAEDLLKLAADSPEQFRMPSGRRRALVALSEQVANGDLLIDPGSDPAQVEARLNAIAGIGRWTSSYVAMRALGDPDSFMPTDLGLRRAAAAMGEPDDPSSLTRRAETWRPWRSYAMFHLWSAAGSRPVGIRKTGRKTGRIRKTRQGETAA
jgi:AraC family transcriptional regulator, regulatory protein of adaptative response / DNA-3-methyladenine glycosylase II